jgi:hypothetical protein
MLEDLIGLSFDCQMPANAQPEAHLSVKRAELA